MHCWLHLQAVIKTRLVSANGTREIHRDSKR